MGSSFAPNHKGMPVLSGSEQLDYIQRQVLTSRNVRGNPLTDFALGGLNYQIEHHLFPNMPRPNLRRAHPLVHAFCQEHDIPFAETGWIDSYRQVLRHLRDVGRPMQRQLSASVAGQVAGPSAL
jgi:fatty acid desaturase